MQKILFNTKYGLEQAVLRGEKTQTRRLANKKALEAYHQYFIKEGWSGKKLLKDFSPLKVGDIVAIAQSYKDVYYSIPEKSRQYENIDTISHLPGWNNKMFVKAEHMPHYVKITDVRLQHLQDISDEDCLAEGIRKTECLTSDMKLVDRYDFENSFDRGGRVVRYGTPKDAYAALIDKISGKGTWDNDPMVFAYTFELIR